MTKNEKRNEVLNMGFCFVESHKEKLCTKAKLTAPYGEFNAEWYKEMVGISYDVETYQNPEGKVRYIITNPEGEVQNTSLGKMRWLNRQCEIEAREAVFQAKRMKQEFCSLGIDVPEVACHVIFGRQNDSAYDYIAKAVVKDVLDFFQEDKILELTKTQTVECLWSDWAEKPYSIRHELLGCGMERQYDALEHISQFVSYDADNSSEMDYKVRAALNLFKEIIKVNGRIGGLGMEAARLLDLEAEYTEWLRANCSSVEEFRTHLADGYGRKLPVKVADVAYKILKKGKVNPKRLNYDLCKLYYLLKKGAYSIEKSSLLDKAFENLMERFLLTTCENWYSYWELEMGLQTSETEQDTVVYTAMVERFRKFFDELLEKGDISKGLVELCEEELKKADHLKWLLWAEDCNENCKQELDEMFGPCVS